MKGSLNFKAAATLSLEELAASFNSAFTGYFYPQQMTASALAQRVRHEQLALQHSLLAFEGEEFVGLSLLALRGSDGWCGGFGVVPEWRGRGCAGELLSESVARLRASGVKRLSLEVLERNTAARRLYERAGMQVTRDLLILERAGELLNSPRYLNNLREAEPGHLLRHFWRLHEVRPAWQRDLAALLVTDGVRGLCLGKSDAPDAYALMVARPDGGGNRLIDLAAKDDDHVNALCAGIQGLRGKLSVINEPADSPFIAALISHGFVETDRQHEMACEL